MPHLVLDGLANLETATTGIDIPVVRWGRAVLKTGETWLRADSDALLVEGVVVELSRPLHPVALISRRSGDTVVRLWPVVPVERTAAVQRWLAGLALPLQELGCGPVKTTNIPVEILADLDLKINHG
jgi:hypothetical protein